MAWGPHHALLHLACCTHQRAGTARKLSADLSAPLCRTPKRDGRQVATRLRDKEQELLHAFCRSPRHAIINLSDCGHKFAGRYFVSCLHVTGEMLDALAAMVTAGLWPTEAGVAPHEVRKFRPG